MKTESGFNYWKCGNGRRASAKGFKGHRWCAPFRIIAMAEPEDSVPWEVRLLQSYCDTEADLDAVSMPMCNSILIDLLESPCLDILWHFT